MRVRFLKPYRGYKRGQEGELTGPALEGVLRRKVAVIVKDTKEDKTGYETKGAV